MMTCLVGTKSMPRNPLLFGMLYRMDVVEHIGSGVRRSRDLCRDDGVPDPIFDISEHWVTATFPRQSEDDGPESRPELGPESTERPESANSGPESGAAQAATPEDDPLDHRVLKLLVPTVKSSWFAPFGSSLSA